MIEIIAPGPLTTVQDGGRTGYAALGVPRSGAFDRGALRLANRLVGNFPGAAGLEITLGGLDLLVHDAATLALAGAACPGVDHGAALTLPAGARLRLGVPASGVRSYLAVRGGLAVRPVLGSAGTDTLSGLGPDPVRAGDRLTIGPAPAGEVAGGVVAAPGVVVGGPRGAARAADTMRLIAGPRTDWFAPDALTQLTTASWSVRPESDRIGVRLDGPALTRARTAELASEPTLPGALQVPPDGRPILLGPDAPVTGGYPVIAVVCDADLDHAGQLRPGDQLRFALRTPGAGGTSGGRG